MSHVAVTSTMGGKVSRHAVNSPYTTPFEEKAQRAVTFPLSLISARILILIWGKVNAAVALK